jgi:hypothetical protein
MTVLAHGDEGHLSKEGDFILSGAVLASLASTRRELELAQAMTTPAEVPAWEP